MKSDINFVMWAVVVGWFVILAFVFTVDAHVNAIEEYQGLHCSADFLMFGWHCEATP